MFQTTRLASLLVLASGALSVGCGEEGFTADTTSGGVTTSSGATTTTTGGASETYTFEVHIENISGDAAVSSPASPGVWAVHASADPIFTEGEMDRGKGLEDIAEDGDPSRLLAALAADPTIAASGIFDTPEGADGRGPIFPGSSFVFTVTASAAAPRLSFASMLGNSNDVFFAPSGEGISLFDEAGAPIASQDVTAQVERWNAGTEIDQAPNSGPVQAPRQGDPGTGPREGRLSPFVDATRALPSASQVVSIDVARVSDGLAITVHNVTGPGTPAVTPISPVFYALHNENWSLFQPGAHASAGVEAIAEDGNPMVLVETEAGATGVTLADAVTVPEGADGPGPALPGGAFTFVVKPSASARHLSIASMFGQSNDAFLAFGPEGVVLADEAGNLRPEADIMRDMQKKLVLWDAGTEANEVPGAGAHQAPRQAAPDTGDADPDATVRRYGDATNDLAGPEAGGVARVSVTSLGGNRLEVTFANTSGATAYPTKLSPLVYAVHDGLHDFFADDEAALAGVERLAEDGNPNDWAAALAGAPGVELSGKIGNAPIDAGSSFSFTVEVTPGARVLDLASMVATSNDTILSLGPQGVALADTQGDLRPIADINADLAAALGAWDAGTEANQAAALGPDQAPRQEGPNAGQAEGNGLVRVLDNVFTYPEVTDMLRVTITRAP